MTKSYIESAVYKNKIKPVVVAVIDTGMYEAHAEFTDKILSHRSKCFLQGKF